jgi:cobalt/nickel transport system permease protein
MVPFAVHISDGILTTPWLAAGFALAAVLVALGSLRVRDEEIPRIALLTAAFFVASLLHIRVGPTSVHLLFNGLVGVILGRRAPLAILVGLFLQVALIGHGGFLTLGVNTCVMAIPALLAGGLFALARPRRTEEERGGRLVREFVLGCVVGAGAVMLTAVLNALVLLWGGAEDWRSLAVVVLLSHLPVAAVEAIIVGFTVSFLARVKPEMLGMPGCEEPWAGPRQLQPEAAADAVTTPPGIQPAEGGPPMDASTPTTSFKSSTLILLVSAAALLASAAPAHAHRLEAEYRVLPKEKKVKVESWFETGDSPRNATVQVYRPANKLLVEGKLNDDGVFVFHYEEPESLRVVVAAPGGHRKELTIPKNELDGNSPADAPKSSNEGNTASSDEGGRFADRSSRTTVKDVLLGIGLLFSAAGFVLGVRNARELRELRRSAPNTSRSEPEA